MTVKELKQYLNKIPDDYTIEVTFLQVSSDQYDFNGEDVLLLDRDPDHDTFDKVQLYPIPDIKVLLARTVIN